MVTRTGWYRLAAGLLATAASCGAWPQAGATSQEKRWACCNLRYDKDWISDRQFTARPFLPVGAPVVITDWGRNRVYADINGVKMRAGADREYFKGSREQFAEVLFLREDPSQRIATFPPAVQAAIRSGRIALGMTKEQVVMALGPPRFYLTPVLGAANWVYFAAEDGEFDLDWAADDTLRAIHAPTRIRKLVELPS